MSGACEPAGPARPVPVPAGAPAAVPGAPEPPDLPVAQGGYEIAVAHGGLVHSAGMTPRGPDGLVTGRVGIDLGVAEAAAAAGLAASRALVAARHAVDRADPPARIVRLLRLGVLIACDAGFTRHSAVADGASRALAAACGGQSCARTAYGVASLPGGACVEVELVAAYEPR